MKKLHPAAAAVIIAVLLAVVLRRNGYPSHGPIDTAIFVVFLVFFWWLISDFGAKPALIPATARAQTTASPFDSAGF